MWIGRLRWLSIFLMVWIWPPTSPAQIRASVQILYFSNFLIFLCQKWRLVRTAHDSPFYDPSIRAFSYGDYVLNTTVETSKEHVFWLERVCIWFHFHSSEVWEYFSCVIMGVASFHGNWMVLSMYLSRSPAVESLPRCKRVKKKRTLTKILSSERHLEIPPWEIPKDRD